MGYVEVGLKQGSFKGLDLGFAFGFKKSVQRPQQLLWDEASWAGNSQKAAVSTSTDCDDSFVDQLLNLNAGDSQEVDPLVDKQEQENQQMKDEHPTSPPPPPLQPPQPTASIATAAGEDDLGSVVHLPEVEPDLEWLSHFVEDSFSQFYPAAGPGIPLPPANPMLEMETEKASLCFSSPANVPRSRRSKRPRSTVPSCSRVWFPAPAPAASPPLSSSLTESTISSSSSATSSPWPPTSPSTPFAFPNPVPHPNPKKKQKKAGSRSGPRSGPGLGSLTRRCSHCGSQKTPQWRAGPMGAKTLCNACGVRFKSGRLFPQYRPASSPTFSSELHSNSHKKVLEMRRKEELTGQPEPGFCPTFTSFG